MEEIIEKIENEIFQKWQDFDYLPLNQVIEDFKKLESQNPKVRSFKELIKKYEPNQQDFENKFKETKKEEDMFSPYCIGYGNITSPIWFLGECEGGPSNCPNENKEYNEKVKTLGVFETQKILEHVLINPYDLNEKYGVGKSYYSNFNFAVKITLSSLGIDWSELNENIKNLVIRKLVGKIQFFTEYWRYRGRKLRFPNRLDENDKKRLQFLKDLNSSLKPIVIVAYCGKKYENQIKNLFNLNDFNIVKFEENFPSNSHNYNKRWVVITKFLGVGQFSNENAKELGNKINKIWKMYLKELNIGFIYV